MRWGRRCSKCGGDHMTADCRARIVPASIAPPAGLPQASAPPAKPAAPPPAPTLSQPAEKRAAHVEPPLPHEPRAPLSAYAAPGICPHCDHRRQQTAERVRRHRAKHSQQPR